VIDADYNLSTDECKGNPIPALHDVSPGILIAIQAIVGTIWWILLMFVYVKNEADLLDSTGTSAVPLVWFWASIADFRGGWTAAVYMTNFFIYLIVSLGELIAWFFYLGGENAWLGMWVDSVGWYGSVIFMGVPPLFALFQLTFESAYGGLGGNYALDYGYNSVF
jgi:hypothetical protein